MMPWSADAENPSLGLDKRRHQHGGDPERELARFGLTQRPVLDFSVNLSPLGPPEELRAGWPKLWELVEAYPSLEGEGVLTFYKERFGLSADRVLPGNGATELIYLVPRALGLRRVAFIPPAYDDYRRAARLAGAEVLPIVTSDPLETPSVELLGRALESAEALFVGQPNNPTGSLVDLRHLQRLALDFPDRWLLVDESFIQFTHDFPANSMAFAESARDLPPNVLVFHSMTKFYAVAGLRLGAVIGAPSTLERLRLFKEPWTVNAIADRVGRELANCRSYERRARDLIRVEGPRLHRRLTALGGIEARAPSANFILARFCLGKLDVLLKHLLSDGLCVRDARNFRGLEGEWFRLAVRAREDNDRLVASLAVLLSRLGAG